MSKIVKEWPPNIDELRKHFDIKGTVFFAYGDAIYNPDGVNIPPDYIAHEEVHIAQQKEFGGKDKWWAEYCANPSFRVSQEVEAYGTQLSYIKRHSPQHMRKALNHFAKALSSSLYGNAISYNQAYWNISKYSFTHGIIEEE